MPRDRRIFSPIPEKIPPAFVGQGVDLTRNINEISRLQSVTARQNFFGELEILMRLVLRSHPRTDPLVQQNVLGVEGFKFGVFRRAQLLRNEVVSAQVQGQADNANRRHPQARDRDEQHEEVQPTFVGEGNPEDLRPETVGGHHRVGFFRLGRLESAEGVGFVAVFKQGVFHGCTVNGTQERPTENPGHSHHVEGIEGPVVEPLQEQQEAEDRRHAEAGGEEPTGLSQGVHQEDADEHGNRAGEGQAVVRTNADETGDFELTQAEADQAESAVEGGKRPQAAELTPASEVSLSFRTPEEQQGVTQAVGRGGNGHGEEVAAFQVGGGQSVGVPGGDEGGSGEPSSQGQVGAGEQQQAGPADEDEAIAFQPVVEDVKPSSLCLCASDCNGHNAILQIDIRTWAFIYVTPARR
jgi:hypothetical protein